jgi:signal transduction histidine kinase
MQDSGNIEFRSTGWFRRLANRDLALAALFFALIVVSLVTFEFVDHLFRLTRSLEHLEVDEWIAAVPALAAAAGWYSWRRWRAEARLTRKLAANVEILENTTESLTEAKGDAERSSRAKSEFLANMSHELRTPLNAIIGFSEVIKDERLGPVGTLAYGEYAEKIHESGLHLLDLVNDILDLSMVEAGAADVADEVVKVSTIVEAAVRLIGQTAAKRSLKIERDLPDRLPMLRADPRKLQQILLNLLSNAIKFTPPRGRVRLKAWNSEDGGFVIQVIDTGVGIAPEDIPKALSHFGRIGNVFTQQQGGTGLGLPLAKTLVELHGGSLDLQSAVGHGTTVTVRLPSARVVQSGDLSSTA